MQNSNLIVAGCVPSAPKTVVGFLVVVFLHVTLYLTPKQEKTSKLCDNELSCELDGSAEFFDTCITDSCTDQLSTQGQNSRLGFSESEILMQSKCMQHRQTYYNAHICPTS